jgi:hypothetical protein
MQESDQAQGHALAATLASVANSDLTPLPPSLPPPDLELSDQASLEQEQMLADDREF